jgi:hypothetical protein
MANSWDDTELGAKKSRAEFSDEFLTGISLTAMSAREFAIKTRYMPCPVTVMPISA